MSEHTDDRDCEACPDCGVRPNKAGCACVDDGSGALERIEARAAPLVRETSGTTSSTWCYPVELCDWRCVGDRAEAPPP